MSDVGTRIPLPSRSLVRPPVDERVSGRAANPALSLAGADEPEPDPLEAVAADPAVVDAEGDTLYSNPVLHVTVHVTSSDAVYGNGKPITDEARRQSRLSRWQAQR